VTNINRRKKAKQTFNKELKRARAKLRPENQKSAKPKYISKADRAKRAEEQTIAIPPITAE